MSTKMYKYLETFTVVKLQLLCRYFNISGGGIKDKIIKKLMKKSDQQKIQKIIDDSKGFKLLVIIFLSDYTFSHAFFSNENDYDWISHNKTYKLETYDNLFYEQQIAVPISSKIDMTNRNSKEKIPATIRNIVWNMYIGTDNKKGMCLCCKTEDISFANFHCGHIISERNGGPLVVENLRPICGHCNSSIGTKNMIEFMERYGIGETPLKFPGDTMTSPKPVASPSHVNVPNVIETTKIDISNDMKTAVWIKYVCNNPSKKCFVCSDVDLIRDTFHCGFLNIEHKNDILNLRPICTDCHDATREMGITPFMDLYGLKNPEMNKPQPVINEQAVSHPVVNQQAICQPVISQPVISQPINRPIIKNQPCIDSTINTNTISKPESRKVICTADAISLNVSHMNTHERVLSETGLPKVIQDTKNTFKLKDGFDKVPIKLNGWSSNKIVFIKENTILHSLKKKFVERLLSENLIIADDLSFHNKTSYIKLGDEDQKDQKSDKDQKGQRDQKLYDEINNKIIDIRRINVGTNTAFIYIMQNISLFLVYKQNIGNHRNRLIQIYRDILNDDQSFVNCK